MKDSAKATPKIKNKLIFSADTINTLKSGKENAAELSRTLKMVADDLFVYGIYSLGKPIELDQHQRWVILHLLNKIQACIDYSIKWNFSPGAQNDVWMILNEIGFLGYHAEKHKLFPDMVFIKMAFDTTIFYKESGGNNQCFTYDYNEMKQALKLHEWFSDLTVLVQQDYEEYAEKNN